MSRPVVQVEIRPAVPFGPEDELLPILDEERRPAFHVGSFPFRHDGFCGISVDGNVAEVKSLKIPARTVQVKALFVSQPLARPEIQISVGSEDPGALQAEVLVLEGMRADRAGSRLGAVVSDGEQV